MSFAELRPDPGRDRLDVVLRGERVARAKLAGPRKQSRIALIRVHEHVRDYRLEHERLQETDTVEFFQRDVGDDDIRTQATRVGQRGLAVVYLDHDAYRPHQDAT